MATNTTPDQRQSPHFQTLRFRSSITSLYQLPLDAYMGQQKSSSGEQIPTFQGSAYPKEATGRF